MALVHEGQFFIIEKFLLLNKEEVIELEKPHFSKPNGIINSAKVVKGY